MISKTCPGARAALLAAALFALPAHAAEEPLATVNGAPITSGDVAAVEDEVGPALAQIPEAQRRDRVIEYLIDLKLLAQRAAKDKLDQGEEFNRRMAYLREKALMETLMKQEVDKAVTDQAVKAFYDEQIGKAPRETEVHARHILVETEDEAKKIAQELKNGADFAELAKKETKDPSGKATGGDLGWFTKEQMVPEFAEAAFKLNPGQISEPVKSGFGWHVIRLEERREKAPPSFDEVKDRIRAFLERRAQAELVGKLRAEAKIERKVPPAPQGGNGAQGGTQPQGGARAAPQGGAQPQSAQPAK